MKSRFLTNKQKKNLKKMLVSKPTNSEDSSIAKFAIGFMFVESILKLILHFDNKNRGRVVSKQSLKLDMRSIPSVLSSVGVNIDIQAQRKLFNKVSDDGQISTAKELRDKIFHEWDESSRTEIEKNISELLASFDVFLNSVNKMLENKNIVKR